MPHLPRIAVLVDLPRGEGAGGHVKYWERLAQAAARVPPLLDLTVYFSGSGPDEPLASHVRYRFLPPVFSTARLKFLSYVPAHTDLAPFHPRLAKELSAYDLIHTTDACFAFARTAERVAGRKNIPLVTSFHTDTPAYAEVFMREMLRKRFGDGILYRLLEFLPVWERAKKDARLARHLTKCRAVLAMRIEDKELSTRLLGTERVNPMRLGVDKTIFTPQPAARSGIDARYGIAPEAFLVLFVGRVDAGKNVPRLLQACLNSVARGMNLHLLVAGKGPMESDLHAGLGARVTCAGQVAPADLALFYAAADALAVVSDIEIGGMVGLEALACGCPVLASSASHVAQACGAEEAMRTVEPSVSAWGDALVELAEDKDLRATLVQKALGFRETRLSDWDGVFLDDFAKVWLKTLGG